MTETHEAMQIQGALAAPLLVIPDANILIHGRALVDLPWIELHRDPIEVVMVPPVIREIDKLKTQTGRPNRIARQVSADIRALLKAPGRSASVISSNPMVTKRVELAPVIAALADGIDLGHADQALINSALYLKTQGHDVLLLTDDTICAASAEGFGVPALLVDDHWLRDTEPDEAAKEVARLRGQVARLEAAEPQVALSFTDPSGGVIEKLDVAVTRWPTLTDEDVDRLTERVEQLCPPATSFEPRKPLASDRLAAIASGNYLARTTIVPPTEEEIEAYRAHGYPDWLEDVRQFLSTLHDKLQTRTEWPMVRATAENTGTRPARDTLLTISASGDFAIEDVKPADEDEDGDDANGARAERRRPLALPLPPSPPRGTVRTIDPFSRSLFGADGFARVSQLPFELQNLRPPKPRDSDAFYWREGRDGWVDQMILECASWRHGQDGISFDLRISPDGMEACAGAIGMSVHAENLSATVRAKLPIRISVVDGATLAEAERLVEALGSAAAASGRL